MDTTTLNPYRVKAGSFEGPLDVLLSLIESRKLLINEVSLSEVTNDYIDYVKSLENLDDSTRINNISAFVIVAATLILIKSKSLLPSLDLTDDEEEKIVDLEERLRLYKIIKESSIDIKNSFGVKILFSRVDRQFADPIFTPDNQMSKENLLLVIEEVFAKMPKIEEKLPEVEVKTVISIDQMINNLENKILEKMNMSFKEFSNSHGGTHHKEVKVNVIVSFLAMLELVRNGIIDVIQNNSFEDITISKQDEIQ